MKTRARSVFVVVLQLLVASRRSSLALSEQVSRQYSYPHKTRKSEFSEHIWNLVRC